ncbi:hypothetical protein BDR26DRAFT_866761 [Obelidium mucronatum]|nr:hypothetical protein BDR26DRAFT_866761 [Obelidium mucronatum]
MPFTQRGAPRRPRGNNSGVSEKRAETNRKSQQAFRERRRELIANLETRVGQLQEEKVHSRTIMAQLQQQLLVLECENAVLKQAAHTGQYMETNSAGVGISSLSSPYSDLSSLSMMGLLPAACGVDEMRVTNNAGSLYRVATPVLNSSTSVLSPTISNWNAISNPSDSIADKYANLVVTFLESIKSQLRESIPSLQSCEALDKFADLFQRQALESDFEATKLNIIKISNLWFVILDHIAIPDRPRAIEILRIALELKYNHVEHLKRQLELEGGDAVVEAKAATKNFSEGANVFRVGVSHIPSLQTPEAAAIVEELCDGFLILRDQTDASKKRELIMRLMLLQSRLNSMCQTDEDRNHLALVIDIGRERNKEEVNQMFSSLSVS